MRLLIRVLCCGWIIIASMAACSTGTGARVAPVPGVPDAPIKAVLTSGLTTEQRRADAHMLVATLERGYGPREWKERVLGVSFTDMSKKFIASAEAASSDAEFYEAIARYIAQFHDTHLSVRFPSTLRSRLGFEVDDVDGKLVVSWVGSDQQYPGVQNIALGDLLLSIDGKRSEVALQELMPMLGNSNPASQRSHAAWYLTDRRQSLFPGVPLGTATLVFRSLQTGKTYQREMPWQVTGYPLAQIGNMQGKTLYVDVRKGMTPVFEKHERRREDRESSLKTAIRGPYQGLFPLGASFVLRREGPYPSGMLIENGLRIGYIRVHTYDDDHFSQQEALEEMREELEYFEREADILLVDQTNNGGGWSCFAQRMWSMLFEESVPEIRRQQRANRRSLLALETEALQSDDDEHIEALQAMMEALRNDMAIGRALSDPLPTCSMDGMVSGEHMREGEAVFSRPVLMLVNRESTSAADLVPAFLQDAGRVVLFGERTNGAGGSVRSIEERIGSSEIRLEFTSSLMVRSTDQLGPRGIPTRYIENVGVVPDVEYQVTHDDIAHGYQGYRRAVMETLSALLR